MAWTTPTTRSTGDLITAANWNTDLVDNLIHLHDNLPACRVYNSANISIADVTETALTFDSERYDTDGIHSVVSNTGRLTCATAGVYHIFVNFQFANGGSFQYVKFRLNGATVIAAARQAPDASATVNNIAKAMQLHTQYKLAATDYVEVLVYHNSGAARNIDALGNWSPEFGMIKVG